MEHVELLKQRSVPSLLRKGFESLGRTSKFPRRNCWEEGKIHYVDSLFFQGPVINPFDCGTRAPWTALDAYAFRRFEWKGATLFEKFSPRRKRRRKERGKEEEEEEEDFFCRDLLPRSREINACSFFSRPPPVLPGEGREAWLCPALMRATVQKRQPALNFISPQLRPNWNYTYCSQTTFGYFYTSTRVIGSVFQFITVHGME